MLSQQFYTWMLGLLIFPLSVSADIVMYTIPGTDLTIPLSGEVIVNPGGTVTLSHIRGKLHFPIEQVRFIRTPPPNRLFETKLRKATSERQVEPILAASRWALHNGLLTECRQALSEAHKLDAKHEQIAKLAAAMPYYRKVVPPSPEIEAKMKKFVGRESMKFERSAHFVLLHDLSEKPDDKTKLTPAKKRLALLEKVYESYFVDFALGGKLMRPPAEPLQVITFAQHSDYLNFVSRLNPELKQAAGFYSPQENLAIFYDQKTDEALAGINSLLKLLNQLREEIRRQQLSGAGDFIRLVKTLELLVEIMKENQDIEVLTHECTHQLAANSGLIPRDSLFVRWTHEGLAAYFESPKEAVWSGIGAVNEQRLAYYRALERDPEHGSIEFLVSDRVFDYAQSNGAVLAAYGQAWALTHFLMETRFTKLMSFYEKLGKLPKQKLLMPPTDSYCSIRLTKSLEIAASLNRNGVATCDP